MWTLLGDYSITAQMLRPQLADSRFVTSNPTLTTVALPFCVFDSLMSKGASYEVYVMANSANTSRTSSTDNSSKPLDATFEQTAGGQRGPYRAAAFNVPNCASSPRLSDAADTTKASAILSQYLIRVGDNVACLSDPNFLEVCNPPLFKDTAYRFKYILVDRTTDVMKDQTLWSYPIKTKKCECVSWSGFYFLEN
ncbi:LOW QUALITY PROTEIN: uroplakin-3a [Varanus komodoensis]|uniref:LOW QUALITY PROTEIN: uroplakin-3a n=1 Tax=Varanus komodoensis TaxID=61221 RepID=UPI001CF7CFC9|nr:LOW QUALITY PROTEIN: uroplakin-3a [Varanus komodoensis]